MADFCKEYRKAIFWFVAVWMVTVLILLAVGPVVHL